uniref:Uncharacterized protein n=1 Tax=Oryza barthii TaxID=65489 RepID=A0A0D3FLA6_9ORYZ
MATSGAGDTHTTSFYSIGNGEPPPTDDHHPTRLPGFAWRFRRHRHPSRRFPASVQDTTASIHRLAYRPCCPCSSNSGAAATIDANCCDQINLVTMCWMAAC